MKKNMDFLVDFWLEVGIMKGFTEGENVGNEDGRIGVWNLRE